MNYQDHPTKFVLLRPLKSKCAEEIAFNLIDIYTTFGAPTIFHSDYRKEFVNTVITVNNEQLSEPIRLKLIFQKTITMIKI
jgi:hypothetical protein